MWKQIAGGSVLLVVSTVLHVACIASSIALLKTMGADYSPDGMIAALASFAAILLGHTIQVWLWALVILPSISTTIEEPATGTFVKSPFTTVTLSI